MDGQNIEKDSAPITVDLVRNECLNCAGYVIFAGIITNQRDAQGNNIIVYRYIRERFAWEDTKKAIKEFDKQFIKDALEN